MARSDQGNINTSGHTGACGDEEATGLEEALSVLESFVASFEPERYSGTDAAVLVERFSRGEHLCATGKALAAKRAATTKVHRSSGHRSAAEWLSTVTGESMGEAIGSLTLADQMASHPGLDGALRSGELSKSRARRVADVLTIDPSSESELLSAARDKSETNRQLADRCLAAKAKARSKEDSLAHDERIRKSRYLRHYTDRDGAFRLEALLAPETGAKVLAALLPTTVTIADEARRARVGERPEASRADALVALVTGERPRPFGSGPTSTGQTSSGSTGPGSTGSGSTGPGQRTTDQVTAGCRPTVVPPPASVHLRVDLAALRRGEVQGGECCEIPGVGPVPIETARSLLGDAIVHLVVTKGADIASVTTLGRTVPTPVRIALDVRDQTCVVPGCAVREGLETDHRIIPFVDGGATALWNLAKLCHHHHYLRTHKGFGLEGGPGDWQWIPPERPPTRDPDDPDDPGPPGHRAIGPGAGDDASRLFSLE